MLQAMSGPVMSKSKPAGKGSVKWVDGDNIINEANMIGKNHTKSSKSGMEFLTSRAMLAFAELRQTFNTALILHYSNPKYYIGIETDASNYTIW